MNLNDLCKKLNRIYEEKNRREGVLTDVNGATLFIAGALKAINDDAVRRDFKNRDVLLAILMKRMLLAMELWGVQLFIENLSRKYPRHGCAYCDAKPCMCGKVKASQATLAEIDASVFEWSLSDWQLHLEHLYGAVNRDRYSIEDMVVQLNSEYLEATIALQHHLITRGSNRLDTVARKAACEETTDFFSRILGLCNHLGVMIEKEVLYHYRNGCPRCEQEVCTCPAFWDEYETYEYAVAATRSVQK